MQKKGKEQDKMRLSCCTCASAHLRRWRMCVRKTDARAPRQPTIDVNSAERLTFRRSFVNLDHRGRSLGGWSCAKISFNVMAKECRCRRVLLRAIIRANLRVGMSFYFIQKTPCASIYITIYRYLLVAWCRIGRHGAEGDELRSHFT